MKKVIATIPEIDSAMKQYGGFKMGPFELMDMIGHDVNYAVTESVWTAFYYDNKIYPILSQKRLVEANWLGKKTGRGFYNYAESSTVTTNPISEEAGKKICNRILVMLMNEAANALYLQIANRDDID